LLPFATGIAFCTAVTVSIQVYHFDNALVYSLVGLALILVAYPLFAVLAEVGTMLLVAAWLLPDGPAASFPSIALTLMLLAGRSSSKTARLLVLPLSVVWFLVFGFNTHGYSVLEVTVLGCIFLSLGSFTLDTLAISVRPIKTVDLILSSSSGNTAHYTNGFIEGIENAGAVVSVHRFHDYRKFAPKLSADALVIAFPVAGWKPPWPLLFYMLRELPKGHGKPAYILMSSAGGPENAALVAKLALILRGYRPVGQSWAVYPINVATFRIGLKSVWRWLDGLVPRAGDEKWIVRSGTEFVGGLPASQPMIIWPTLLSVIGFLGDNPWFNVLVYRNHAWKRRCKKCGLCVRYCPAHRLGFVHGYPKACGTCTLCFGCVNLCPTNAMQIWLFTEYGNPYKPRWPELVHHDRAAGVK
jgi:ferredoxin